MITPQPPLEAYRTDLVEAPMLDSFGPDDGSWLLAATLLERWAHAVRRARRAGPYRGEEPDAVPVTSALREVCADLARDAGPGTDPGDVQDGDGTSLSGPADEDALDRRVLALAERIEEGGALRLAYTALTSLAEVMAGASARTHGLALAQRARVARKLGDLEVAEHLYGEAARVGRASGDHDLVVRAALGRGVVARIRGNYPRARTLFRRALRTAERVSLPELASLAHHGLLITAGVAGDFDTALKHGWAAFRLAEGDAPRQADLLGTLGALASDAGYDAAALRAYLAAVRCSPAARVRLPALAGAAVSAARLGDARQLEALTRAVECELQREAMPYERAQALALLAQAWAIQVPETGGEPYRGAALVLAETHGFHELSHSGSAGGVPVVRAAMRRPASAAPSATRTVLRALESLEPVWTDEGSSELGVEAVRATR